MKWWCPGGVRARGPRALGADTGVGPRGPGPAGARGAARGSSRRSASGSKPASRTWAVLRGCRSFCTAGEAGRVRTPRQPRAPVSSATRLWVGSPTHRPGSCPPASTSSAGRPGTGSGAPCPPGTSPPPPGTCKRKGAPGRRCPSQALHCGSGTRLPLSGLPPHPPPLPDPPPPAPRRALPGAPTPLTGR